MPSLNKLHPVAKAIHFASAAILTWLDQPERLKAVARQNDFQAYRQQKDRECF